MSANAVFAEHTYPTLESAATRGELERAQIRGHAAGYAAGMRKAEQEAAILADRASDERAAAAAAAQLDFRSALDALVSAVGAVTGAARLVLAESDAALASAAIELAEVVLGRELASGEDSAKAALARALATAEADDALAIRLNPDDLATLAIEHTVDASFNLVADPTLSRGDAVLDLPRGRVDARIASALDRARAEILGGA